MNPYSPEEKTSQTVQDKFLATYCIFKSDQKHYNTLLQYLKKYNLKGLDAYHDTANEVINTMNNYCAALTAGAAGRHTNHNFSSV